ncbi:MAG: TonB-dependent receptor [Bacteroidota bacterium]|nr:TonB-dependent receptor [Bacteroidota bacterium]
MKLSSYLFILGIFVLSALGISAQNQKVSLNLKNAPIKDLFNEIEKQTDYLFFFSKEKINSNLLTSVSVTNKPVSEVLNDVFRGTGMRFTMVENHIVVTNETTSAGVDDANNRKHRITGVVRDPSGDPLIGVNVRIKGSAVGTITDNTGHFSIEGISEKSVLQFSYIGFSTIEKSVGRNSVLEVTLQEAAKTLEEIVVIGYGQVNKSDVTGALASVTSKQIEAIPVKDITSALQGAAAGVDIGNTAAQPGSLPQIRIRGSRSITAGNEPLYVLDGIPLTGGIAEISPGDIESMEVLKDASATAIYGSRGANGVILITSKKGIKGVSTVSYDSYLSMDSRLVQPDMMTGGEFAEMVREANRAAGRYNTPYPDPQQDYYGFSTFYATRDPAGWAQIARAYEWVDKANLIPKMRATTPTEKAQWGVNEVPVYNASRVGGYDWLSRALRTAVTQNHQFSTTFGNDKVRALFSAAYLDQQGVIKTQGYQRLTLRLNTSFQVNDNVKFGVQNMASLANKETGVDMFAKMTRQVPYAVPYDENGNFIEYPGGSGRIYNAINDPKYSFNEDRTTRYVGTIFGEIKLPLGWSFRSNIGLDFKLLRNGQFNDVGATNSQVSVITQSNARYYENQDIAFTWDNLLYYDKKIKNHSVGLTLLESMEGAWTEGSEIRASGLPYSSQRWFNIGSTDKNAADYFGSWYSHQARESFMGRLNYSYNNRYLLTVSNRWDGSSVLAEGHKWAAFPSMALAWKMHEEDFLKNNKVINSLKLRIGYGQTGNSAINPYQTGGTLVRTVYVFGETAASGYGFGSLGATQGSMANKRLGWEKTSQYNLGVDFGLWKNRVSGTVDLYLAKTYDLLLNQIIPSTNGFTSWINNIGATQNRGIEVSLHTVNIDKKKLTWTTDLTFTRNKEKITALSNGRQDDIANLWFIGQPITVFYDYQYDGIWSTSEADKAEMAKFAAKGSGFTPGTIRIKDQNHDYKIDASDKVILGTGVPKWSAGMTNTFSYKGIELSCMLFARIGQMLNSNYYKPTLSGIFQCRNVNYWTPYNQDAEYPRPNVLQESPNYISSMGYRKGSFLKVKNIGVSYAIPKTWTQKLRAKKFTLYVKMVNPFVISDHFEGLDPEGDIMSYKSVVCGLKLSI